MKDARFRALALAVALAVALSLSLGGSIAEAGFFRTAIGSGLDLLNLTWE